MDVNYQDYGMDQTVAEAYADSLREHIAYVREAGRKLGVLEDRLAIHDDSKWSLAEFPGYAMHFQGGGDPDGFAAAWLHHIHHNPHHWQHWIFPDGFTPKGSNVEAGVIEMPANYCLEMVADWMGAGMAYTGSWDMSKWLSDNFHKVRVHSRTARYLLGVLKGLGYEEALTISSG